ncbi:prepilin-type N-terminal cleavage/methylation domain-containing protein [Virgibacillus dakarensis]|uniref:ComG operon protein 3 n=1 Tax=Lentibacillus populi TaxID=1827502 RepID=A0A9W5TUH7_9BACI|nr:competence type IV pilus major pilin ComGC [Lentibacillus populi]MTW85145.1 prepilin-type N-terminal cleavage/methylation domain-containing protein [Virgibacillus dakarensis]GGB29429.1 competence protein ComGC [Lentibacillus populi]
MLKNQNGFTLIEMLIVLMIISVLIILIIPNLGEKSKDVNKKGCDALVSVVQSQVDSYYLDKKSYPASIDVLVPEYINDKQKTCPNGKALVITDGKVSAPK